MMGTGVVSQSCTITMELLIGICSSDVRVGYPSSGVVSLATFPLSGGVSFKLFRIELGRYFGRTDGYLGVLQ